MVAVAVAAVAGMTISRSLAGRIVSLAVLLALSIVLLAPPEAHAQDRITQAREHFDRGKSFFQQGSFEQALSEFMKAYVLDPNPVLVYNIARAHEERQDLDNALKYFRNYLKMSPRARNRRAVRRKIRQLQRAIRNRPRGGLITVRTEPRGATVRVNGRVMGKTPITDTRFAVGRHRIEITHDNFETYYADVILQSGRTTTLDIRLVDRPSPVVIDTEPRGAVAVLQPLNPQAPGEGARNLGACPCVVELRAGQYRLQLNHAQTLPKQITFTKQPGEQLKLNVRLDLRQQSGMLVVDATAPNAQLIVNGVPMGTLPLAQPVPVPLGPITVDVTAPNHQPWRQVVTVNPAGLTRLQAVLVALGPTGPIGPTQPQIVYRHTDGGTTAQTGWGWALTGVGIAALVGGGLTTMFALLDQKKFDDATFFKEPSTGSFIRQDMSMLEALELEDRAVTLQNASIGLYVSGGVLLLTGVILLATDSGPEMNSVAGDRQFGVMPIPGGAMMTFEIPLH